MATHASCNSEGRAFFVLDGLSPGALVWAQKALTRFGSTLAVALKQPCPVGVAVVQRSKAAGQAAQLQVRKRFAAAHDSKSARPERHARCPVVCMAACRSCCA
jgi:hypothetical protein